MRYKLHQGEWLLQTEIESRRQAAHDSPRVVQPRNEQRNERRIPRTEAEVQMEGIGTKERRTETLDKETLSDLDPSSPFQYQENISTEPILTSTPNLSTSKSRSTQQV